MRRNLEKTLLILIGATSLTAILMNLDFNLLEASLYDFRMSHGFQSKANNDIVLVTLDNATTQFLNEFPPLTLDIHTSFVEALSRYQPKAVGYLVDMSRVAENNPDQFKAEWGPRFVQAAKKLESQGVPFMLGTPFDVTGEVIPPYPLSSLPHSIAVIHRDGNVFSEDKVTRRALTYLYDRPAFHIEFLQKLGLIPFQSRPRGSFYVPETEGQYFYFRYQGNTAIQQKFQNELPYSRISFLDILNGSIPQSAIQNKILLVGTLIKEDAGDFTYTPYSKIPFANPKLAIHATILDSILKDNGILRVDPWVNALITFLAITIILLSVLDLRPLSGVFVTFGVAATFSLLAWTLFASHGLWMRMSQPLIGIFLAYYLVVPYRLIREYKKRWDYQRKNELLLQVEELKTNFLSLVTHDLKTPVARIQGLAEVLLRKAADRLVERDRETITHIIESTEELNRFISSILELSKVESQKLKLNLEFKDVNQIIEKNLELFKAQCRARQIKLISNLEPMFPIRLDALMIGKVLNNIIDNAIKYSPEGSQISILTREAGEFVEIVVQDQGIGMSEEERKNLFTRFYRAKNDTTTKIAGTGLGLYLSKFFVEAHKGAIEVQSQPHQGTTFVIRLPIHAEVSEQFLNPVTEKPGLTQKTSFGWLKKRKEGA